MEEFAQALACCPKLKEAFGSVVAVAATDPLLMLRACAPMPDKAQVYTLSSRLIGPLREYPTENHRIFPLPSRDWVIQRAYSLSPHAIGSYNGHILSPLARLGHTTGTFPLPTTHAHVVNIAGYLASSGRP
eukprot:367373-Pyramimonas_sp.AAC.1